MHTAAAHEEHYLDKNVNSAEVEKPWSRLITEAVTQKSSTTGWW